MFSWICPRCGRENRPSDTECPNCRELDAQAAAPAFDTQETAEIAPPQRPPLRAPEPVRAPPEPVRATDRPPAYAHPAQTAPPVYAPPVYAQAPPPQASPVYPHEQPRYAPPPPPAPPPPQRDPMRAPLQHPDSRRYVEEPAKRSGLPTWLLIILFAFAFIGLGAAVFYGYQRYQKGGGAGFTGGETPASAPKPRSTSPLQKYIEVVGIRVTTDAKKRPEARFVVVNHSNTELDDLTANVTLWASTSRSEEDSVGTFAFKLASLSPNEAKEITTPLKTKLKTYEMPEWQNVTAEIQITSP